MAVNTDRLCYNCFREREEQTGPCPFCGYDPAEDAAKYPLALKPGSVLNGQYIIGRVLGQGGFGVTYLALDHNLGVKVAIKEFLPESMATRLPGTTLVSAYSGEQEENFTYGAECFLDEARVLAKFIGNPNIVAVKSYFTENGTSYFVMDYIEGTSFKSYIKNQGGRVEWQEALRILMPVMDALGAVHREGIIHRDVTPDNIYITGDGTVKLLDFGAARYSLGDRSRSLDVILKAGYAPKEQYTRRGRQGPYTDVYSLAACFYSAITGFLPPEALERMEEDDLIPISTRGIDIPAGLEDAILKGLEVRPEDRYQSMEDFRAAIEAAGCLPASQAWHAEAHVYPAPEPTPVRPVTDTGAVPPPAPGEEPGNLGGKGKKFDLPKEKKRVIGFAGVGAVALILIVVLIVQLTSKKPSPGPAPVYTDPGGAISAGDVFPSAPTLPDSPETALLGGTTVGNISNMGLVAEQDGWIYFSDCSNAGSLCRVRSGDIGDGKKIEILVQDECSYISVSGDWIYYCNDSDDGCLYRVKTDGSGRERIVKGSTSYITVTEEWIYYIEYVSSKSTGEIYRIRTSLLGDKQLLADDCKRMALDGNRIYYVDSEYDLYSVGTDGTGRTMLTNKDIPYSLNVADGWIYYQNNNDEDTLYRIRTDGTERGQVLDADAEFLNVYGGWIYFGLDTQDDNRGTSLWKVRTDGTGEVKLADCTCLRLNVIDGYVYYVDSTQNYDLFRVPADGSSSSPERIAWEASEVVLMVQMDEDGEWLAEALKKKGLTSSVVIVDMDDLKDFSAELYLMGGDPLIVFTNAMPDELTLAMEAGGGYRSLQPKNWEETLYTYDLDASTGDAILAGFESLTQDVHVRDKSMNGNVYSGYVNASGKPDIYGKMAYSSGEIYYGGWKNGLFEGTGILSFADGDYYVGNFVNDKYEGYGIYYWEDGDYFEGEFVGGERNGEGTLYYSDGTSKSGTWYNDEYVG